MIDRGKIDTALFFLNSTQALATWLSYLIDLLNLRLVGTRIIVRS